jgi:DNA-binding GntR family transcriptional regulator
MTTAFIVGDLDRLPTNRQYRRRKLVTAHEIELTSTVHAALRDAILDGRLEQGERVNQDRVARELGVSRTPVREALRWLERDGLVRLEQNRGAFVASFTARDLFEIYELRELLEPHAAAIASMLATRAEIAGVRDMLERIEQAADDDRAGAFALNRRFHERLCGPCQNGLLMNLLGQVWSQNAALRIFTYYAAAGPEVAACTHHQHRAIVEAYAARDPDGVRELVRAHIAEAHDMTAGLIARAEEVA